MTKADDAHKSAAANPELEKQEIKTKRMKKSVAHTDLYDKMQDDSKAYEAAKAVIDSAQKTANIMKDTLDRSTAAYEAAAGIKVSKKAAPLSLHELNTRSREAQAGIDDINNEVLTIAKGAIDDAFGVGDGNVKRGLHSGVNQRAAR